MQIKPAFFLRNLLCLLVFLQALHTVTNAQSLNLGTNPSNPLLTDVVGRPAFLKIEYNMEGSPFYPSEYTKADIYTKSGKVYPRIDAKFNLQDNSLLLRLDDGYEMVVATPVPRLVFADTGVSGHMLGIVFQNGYPAVDNQTTTTYYQVLDSGRISLLKSYSVTYMDKKEYGQASITRVYEQKETWYLYLPDKSMRKVEKGKDSFLAIFPDKKDQLRQYIDQNGYKCKKDDEWLAVTRYYNSLQTN